MKPLSPSARRLFELARGQDEPDELARNRVARLLSVKIAAGLSVTAAGASAATAAGWGAILTKSVVLLCTGGALVAGGWLTVSTLRPSARVVTAPAPVPSISKPAPVVEADEPLALAPLPSEPTREPAKLLYRRPARHSPLESAARANVIEDRLHQETEALRLAQRALREKAPEQALRLLDEQDLRFRDGQLPQERTAARILALCQAGRVEEARVQANRFERLWPGSALLGRVRSACWAP